MRLKTLWWPGAGSWGASWQAPWKRSVQSGPRQPLWVPFNHAPPQLADIVICFELDASDIYTTANGCLETGTVAAP